MKAGLLAGTSGDSSGPDRSAYETEVLSDSPLLYWPMDSARISGTTYSDISGNARHGTSVGSPAVTGTGWDDSSVPDFDGSNDRVEIADAAWMDVANFTLEFWINLRGDTGENGCMVARDVGAPNRLWGCRITSTGVGYVEGTTDRSSGAPSTSTTSISDSDWHHVAWVARSDGTQSIWVDGSEETYSSRVAPPSGAAKFTVGSSGIPSQYFGAELSDIAFYGSALTGTQINDHLTASGV